MRTDVDAHRTDVKADQGSARRLIAGALLGALIAALPGLAAGAAQAVEQRFGVFYDGKRIGQHTYEVIRGDGATRVRSRADFRVKVLFVTAYRYRHQANELWQDGCLAGLASVTDDNGERYRVEARTRQAGLQLTRLEPGSNVTELDGDCPASFAYWDRSRLNGGALINAQTGDVVASELIEEGRESVDGEPAVRYRLNVDGMAPIHLWYRASDDGWIRLQTSRNGGTLEYRLEQTERRTVSAIDQDARVEDPPGI